jgi:hypothetical protein
LLLTATGQFTHKRQNIVSQLKAFESAVWLRDPQTDKLVLQPDPDGGVPPPVQPGAYRESEERTPIHAPSLSAQWATPTAKALTVWTGTSALSFAVLAGYMHTPRPGLAAFVIGGIPSAIQWMRDQEYFKNALYQVKNFTEEFLQQDLDSDGVIGQPKHPGTIVIKGRNSQPESEASKKRRALIAFAELVYNRQRAKLNTGAKELYGTHLPGGYKINYDLHKELGRLLVDSGYAGTKQVGRNTTWELLPDVTPDELNDAIGTWNDN